MCELQCRDVVYLDDYDPDNPDHVVITFDGVYKNVLDYAAPILKKFGYPFDIFISSDYIGKDNKFDTIEPDADFASMDDLKELVRSGGRIQWHTRSHRDLKDETNTEEIIKELTVPENLYDLDDNGFKWFAYTHGNFNDILLKETKKRFKGAVSCIQGNDTDIYKLNRVTVTDETSFKKGSVAVIIPSYNYGSFLVEAIESALKQTRPADEILISDDCSTDNTMEIALEYQRRYPELIKFNRNEENLGIIKHFNKAVSMVSSDYICFLGADNRFRSDYIERTAGVLDADEKTAVAYCDYALFDKRAKLEYDKFPEDFKGPILDDCYYIINFYDFNEETKKILLGGTNFIHGSSLIRRDAFIEAGGYQHKENTPEDYNLFCRIIKNEWLADRVPQPLLEYRQHSINQDHIQLALYSELNFYKQRCKALSEELYKMGTNPSESVTALKENERTISEMNDQVYRLNLELGNIHSSRSWRLVSILKIPFKLARSLKDNGVRKTIIKAKDKLSQNNN
jgi:glycosyltransferase involved in cell wall biosynthesis